MAKLNPNDIQFTGSLSNLSAYKMRGHDRIILRTKGGASKKHIEKNPKFEKTRNLNNEWKAVCMASLAIRQGLNSLKTLADYNVSGPLNALVKKIQVTDTVNPKGKRSIRFSQQPDALSSFHFNRQTIFDSIICQPLDVSIDKTSAVVDVRIPPLQPLVNFFPNPRYAYYRIILDCTGLSDFACFENGDEYHNLSYQYPTYIAIETEWAIAKVSQPSASIQLLPKTPFNTGPNMIFVFGAGIQYGMPGADGTIQPVPFAGAARIMKTI
jgi:hypothetical protein